VCAPWWANAPVNSWEDWLNESFAEYSALMAVRELFGAERFEASSLRNSSAQKACHLLRALKGMRESFHRFI